MYFFSYEFSHFERINDILWINDYSKDFFTCSNDQALMKWCFNNNKWTCKYYDLLKLFDSYFDNYTFDSDQRKLDIYQSENRIKNVKVRQKKYFINVLVSNPKFINNLIGGDNRGNIFSFDIEMNKQVKKANIQEKAINSLSFSNNGNYLAVGFEDGSSVLLDYFNEFMNCMDLENSFIDVNEIKNRKEKYNNFLSCKIIKITTLFRCVYN